MSGSDENSIKLTVVTIRNPPANFNYAPFLQGLRPLQVISLPAQPHFAGASRSTSDGMPPNAQGGYRRNLPAQSTARADTSFEWEVGRTVLSGPSAALNTTSADERPIFQGFVSQHPPEMQRARAGPAHRSSLLGNFVNHMPSRTNDVQLPWESRGTALAAASPSFAGGTVAAGSPSYAAGSAAASTSTSRVQQPASKKARKVGRPRKEETGEGFTGVTCDFCGGKTADIMLHCTPIKHCFCQTCVEDFLTEFQCCPTCRHIFSGYASIPTLNAAGKQ